MTGPSTRPCSDTQGSLKTLGSGRAARGETWFACSVVPEDFRLLPSAGSPSRCASPRARAGTAPGMGVGSSTDEGTFSQSAVVAQ